MLANVQSKVSSKKRNKVKVFKCCLFIVLHKNQIKYKINVLFKSWDLLNVMFFYEKKENLLLYCFIEVVVTPA